MRDHRHRPTQHRTDYLPYPPYRPTPPTAVTLALAVVPLAGMYLLTHPAVAATFLVAASVVAGALVRRD